MTTAAKNTQSRPLAWLLRNQFVRENRAGALIQSVTTSPFQAFPFVVPRSTSCPQRTARRPTHTTSFLSSPAPYGKQPSMKVISQCIPCCSLPPLNYHSLSRYTEPNYVIITSSQTDLYNSSFLSLIAWMSIGDRGATQ